MPRNISSPSVRSLHIETRFNGQSISCATAFVARRRAGRFFLITNRHNVTGRNPETGCCLSPTLAEPNEIVVTHNLRGDLGKFAAETVPLFDEHSAPRWIEHPVRHELDVVAIPIAETAVTIFFPYEPAYVIGDPPGLAVADRVSVVGFPFGIRNGQSFAVWATGYVATEPEVDHDGPTFLIDCRTRTGQSGSPVIRAWKRGERPVALPVGQGGPPDGDDAELLGIYCGRVNRESDLGRVIKARVIAELVDAASILSGTAA